MKKSYFTDNSIQTKKLGEDVAKKFLKSGQGKDALVLGLIGDLGGGKTTFLQGFARGLGIKQKITSPTFVIMKKFPIYHAPFSDFYHVDCYRIGKPKEILDLGLKEIVLNPKNIVAVEWADKIRKALPKDIVILRFGFINKNKRKIVVEWK